ncbi:cold-shock protein [Mesorhizobium sp. WSM2239]|uniref:Cold-shock protein n=2 Tax=unclassified Mesorhizobium TaxID=325217 RepID=A0AAU8DH94_9HYPH
MGKYRNHREPRHQRLQHDATDDHTQEPTYFQRQTSANSASADIAAEVLWFNAQKGFGFVKLADGSEAYLHISKLQASGHAAVHEGAYLRVRIEAGPKGPQVAQVLTVSGGTKRSSDTGRRDGRVAPKGATRAEVPEQESAGAVKWYNATKGFGFISLEDSGRDVFVHATALTGSGLIGLDEGQKVIVRYAQGQKGLEARTIHPA